MKCEVHDMLNVACLQMRDDVHTCIIKRRETRSLVVCACGSCQNVCKNCIKKGTAARVRSPKPADMPKVENRAPANQMVLHMELTRQYVNLVNRQSALIQDASEGY